MCKLQFVTFTLNKHFKFYSWQPLFWINKHMYLFILISMIINNRLEIDGLIDGGASCSLVKQLAHHDYNPTFFNLHVTISNTFSVWFGGSSLFFTLFFFLNSLGALCYFLLLLFWAILSDVLILVNYLLWPSLFFLLRC